MLPQEQILHKQIRDEFCNKIRREIKEGLKDFLINEDSLIYKFEQPISFKLVLPKIMVSKVLNNHHNTPFNGYRGIKRTRNLIKSRYYSLTMSKDIENHVACRVIRGKIKDGQLL